MRRPERPGGPEAASAGAARSGARGEAILRSERFGPLLESLGIPRRAEPVAGSDAYRLVETDEGLELRPPGEGGRRGIRAAFPPPGAARHPGTPPARRPALARAFGRSVTSILDATAGLGADAYRLAEAGYAVRAVERDPWIFALVASAWSCACKRDGVPTAIAERLQFVRAEARCELEALARDARSTAAVPGVYLDPMYPAARRRSARPKRERAVMRALLGSDEDAAELLATALRVAGRVVVKRPHRARPLRGGVAFELASKLVRFDVYLGSRVQAVRAQTSTTRAEAPW